MITGIFPPDSGGPATYVPLIAGALAARGHRVIAITLSDDLGHDDRYAFQVHRLARRRWLPLRMLATMLAIARLGRTVDLLYVHGLFLEAALANVVLRKPLVLKAVGDLIWERVTRAGLVRDGFDEFQRRAYGVRVQGLKAIRNWWTRHADRVIANCRYMADWVIDWGADSRHVAVVYNAVEPPAAQTPSVVIPLTTEFTLVTAARLVPWKRIDHVLDAIRPLIQVGLIVVGDGPERLRLEGIARSHGLEHRVYFAGARRRAETLAYMADSDAFILSSTWETFPHALLEAMHAGLPIIATRVGGVPEMLEDQVSGLLVRPDPTELREAIVRLFHDAGLRRELVAEAQRAARERFSVERMVNDTEAVLADARVSR